MKLDIVGETGTRYALYRALRRHHGGAFWFDWPADVDALSAEPLFIRGVLECQIKYRSRLEPEGCQIGLSSLAALSGPVPLTCPPTPPSGR
ncbi:MAG: hypothetical protein O2780_21710, partial [Proteobacteria bacterium]|nr:hypothetical protein [Pseudomonadota bacterium]